MNKFYRTLITGAGDTESFIITVKTDNAGTSDNDQFTIPTIGAGYNYDVVTSDGQSFIGQTGNLTITFPSAGTYDVKITGDFPRIYFNIGGDRSKLIDIKQWGEIAWATFTNSFWGCNNLTNVTATDSPDLSLVTNMDFMFTGCSNMTTLNVTDWNVSSVNSMILTFAQCSNLITLNVSNWNVSSVTNFTQIFFSCTVINNLDVSSWNVSSATTLNQMFYLCNNLNTLNVSSWNVSSVTNMEFMFANCPFNQNLGGWNIGSLTTANVMFASSSMTTANYTDTIVGWANFVFDNGGSPTGVGFASQTGRTFDNSRSGGVNFADAEAARLYLTSAPQNWTISGDTII